MPNNTTEYVFLIEYDLIKDKDYSKIIAAIKKFNHTKLLLSSWCIKTTYSSEQIAKHLMQYIDKDDKLIVIQITTHGTVENITANTINWLKTNLN